MRKILRRKAQGSRKRTIKRRIKPYWATDSGELYCGEASKILSVFENKVDLIVTSPPYDNLRSYKGYVFNFRPIARAIFRSLKEGGVLVWVVADQTEDYSESGNSFRQALYFNKIGLNIYDTMIYKKASGLPMHDRRYTQEWDYMFVFSKGNPNTFNPIMIQSKRFTTSKIWDHTKRKYASAKDGGAMVRDKAKYLSNRYKKIGNIWTYRTGGGGSTKDKIAHECSAIFPEKLARDHIITWSNERDLVLDPMAGSGTTCKMAEKLKRRWVSIDYSKEHCEIIKKRMQNISHKNLLF